MLGERDMFTLGGAALTTIFCDKFVAEQPDYILAMVSAPWAPPRAACMGSPFGTRKFPHTRSPRLTRATRALVAP